LMHLGTGVSEGAAAPDVGTAGVGKEAATLVPIGRRPAPTEVIVG
jgi:hypothetical protein